MQATVYQADLHDAATQRQTMVDCQIRTFDVTDQRLIARLLAVPRERFVPDAVRALAYSDVALEMVEPGSRTPARTLLPPLVLARLIQGGRVTPRDRVLDVAPGGGYSTAVLAGLGAGVTALEDTSALRQEVEARLASVGLGRVPVFERSLDQGVAEGGPFDVILVNGAIEVGLERLLAQLAEGGRLVAIRREPVDPSGRAAKAMAWEKRHGEIGTRYLFDASAPVPPAFRRPPAFAF